MARLLVNKELRVLIKDLQGLGYTVRRDGGQHLKVYTHGRPPVVGPAVMRVGLLSFRVGFSG